MTRCKGKSALEWDWSCWQACRQLFYFGDITEGMAKEIERAHMLGIPVEYVPEETYTHGPMKMEGLV